MLPINATGAEIVNTAMYFNIAHHEVTQENIDFVNGVIRERAKTNNKNPDTHVIEKVHKEAVQRIEGFISSLKEHATFFENITNGRKH